MTEPISTKIASHHHGLRSLAFSAALLATACMGLAQAAPHTRKPHASHKSHQAAPAPEPAPQATPAPEPEQPKWPVNDAPAQPSITFDAQGLHIQAANSSLSKILSDVSTATGAKVEGLTGDERVFGDYGPGQPRDVLAQLLHGSSYNFLLLGDLQQGAPLEVILTRKRPGGANNPNPNINPGYQRTAPEPQPDDDPSMDQPEEQPQPEPPQAIQPVQPMPPNPDQNGPMTPQQRMQMMQQQRMQQLQQMQQQQQQQQPQ